MVFHILNVFFLDSVNRSLYNDCFRAILRFIKGILVFFFLFSPREVYIRNLFYLRMARTVFEGTNMVNTKGSNGHF